MGAPNASSYVARGTIGRIPLGRSFDRRTRGGYEIVGWYVVDEDRQPISRVVPDREAAEDYRRTLITASGKPYVAFWLRPVIGSTR